MAENRFAFTTDDPAVAAQIMAIMGGAPSGATSTRKAADKTPPAAPVHTAPPSGVPDAAPPLHTPPPPAPMQTTAAPPSPQPSTPGMPPAPPAPQAAPPPPAPEPSVPAQTLPGWDYERDIKSRLQLFVGKYSGGDLKKWLMEHFGVPAGVQVLAAEWPRLREALDHAINS